MIDRRIQKSQDGIKTALIQIMSEKDFEEITIQNITETANVGRRTFYYHYEDKYDLLTKVISEQLDNLRDICQSARNNELNGSELLWFDYFERHYSFFSTMLSGKGQVVFRQQFMAFVIDELKGYSDFTQGINQGIDEEVFLVFFSSAIVGIIEDYFSKNQPKTSKLMAEQVMLLLNRNM